MKRIIIASALVCLVIISCKKDDGPECATPDFFPLPEIHKQFNFKLGSFWVIKNTQNGKVDTIKVHESKGLKVTDIGPDGAIQPCLRGRKESFELTYRTTAFLSAGTLITGGALDDKIGFSHNSYSYLGLLQAQPSASIDTTAKSVTALEKVFSTMVLQGDTFANVHQMFYRSRENIGIFTRIWWCPGVGFIKFQYQNPDTKLTENWELVEHKVELH